MDRGIAHGVGEVAHRRRFVAALPEAVDRTVERALLVEFLEAGHDAYSPDGRFLKDGPETALKVLKAFDPNVQSATIDLAKTYMTKFVEAAQTGH